MYENGFYPTPPNVINKMIAGLEICGSILDPSAGKGDLLEGVKSRLSRYDRNPPLYAIEINPELRPILIEKGFKVIDTDFLQYPGLQYFNIIIMNPPFDEGAKHLLKAWEIAGGATIRCLLNSDTLANPYTAERKRIAQIIERYGWAKELGPVFKDAERKTSVNVTLVHLEDTRQREPFRLDFDPETVNDNLKFDENTINNELAMANIFENYEARYNATLGAFKELLAARQKVIHHLTPLATDYPTPASLLSDVLKSKDSADISYQAFLETVTRTAWGHLFSKTKLAAVTTEGVRQEIQSLQNKQGVMAFTATNMEQLFSTLFMNRENIMTQCVLESFDEMTKYYKENREYYEGWKTNSAYKVGKKFILPGIGSYFSSGIDYRSKNLINDIEKSLCFLSGKRYEDIKNVTSLYEQENHWGKWITSEFFQTKLFKKKTMHFKWIDENLRTSFNTLVARERWGELPEKTKQGAYK